mgnify:CR=1 FL=1
MSALFVALGIMVLALLALLLWFVPHLLQQQATRVAGETGKLREMGAQGQLTADMVVGALEKQAGAINEQFGKMAPTVSRQRRLFT